MKVGLVGCGLIGGSIGLRLKDRGIAGHVTAYDIEPSVAQRAVARGAADRAAGSVEEAATDADIVVVAAPVGVIPDLARAASRVMREGAVLTDVGSTKAQLVLEVERWVTPGVHFIGGHPMAGSEDEGIEAASADLFDGAWWILTPTGTSDAEAYGRLNSFVTTLGGRVMAMDPTEHDRAMAVISHVPQLVASTLMNVAAEAGASREGLLALAAGGFKDVTRIAASNPEIWADVCQQNAGMIGEALEHLTSELSRVRALLDGGDVDSLRAFLTKARAARRALPERDLEGGLYDIRFPIPDRPGVLADVTTAIGELGINIADLRIAHSTEGGRGTLHLMVAGPSNADRAAATLRARGYPAKTGAI